jgi:anaerobic dimethyl sulfoxide reductase subunit C (anchor subunit)
MASTAVQWLTPSLAHSVRPVAIAAFPIAACATGLSIFHLGRPFSAWRSLRNLGASRLSGEVALTGIFVLAAFLYCMTWLARGVATITTGSVTSALGMLAVISSARIYVIPTQRFWNAGWVICSFVSSPFLLGGTAVKLFLGPGQGGSSALLEVMTQLGSAAMLVSAIWMIGRFQRIARARYAGPETYPLMSVGNWMSLSGFILFAALIPLLGTRMTTPRGALLLLAGVALAGVLLGRSLMYSLGTKLARF